MPVNFLVFDSKILLMLFSWSINMQILRILTVVHMPLNHGKC